MTLPEPETSIFGIWLAYFVVTIGLFAVGLFWLAKIALVVVFVSFILVYLREIELKTARNH